MTLSSVFVTGFSHHQLDITSRSLVNLDDKQQQLLFSEALKEGIQSLLILNTCNRTEIYGIGDVQKVSEIFCRVSPVSLPFYDFMFQKKGKQAIDHMLKVAAGMDSKIIGDLEILGQFKKAIATSKEVGLWNGTMERITNHCLAAAKEIRTKTKITSGSVSASYAVVKKIKDHFGEQSISILLIGTGKFGSGIAKNIVQHLPNADLTTTNRTDEKSKDLSAALGMNHIEFSCYIDCINNFDVIITSVNADNGFLIDPSDLNDESCIKWLVDMSVPFAINQNIKNQFPTIKLLNLDQISEELQSTIETRKSELPLAEEILKKHKKEIIDRLNWSEKSEIVRNLKNKIIDLSNECPHLKSKNEPEKNSIVEKNIKNFAKHLKSNGLEGNNVEAIMEDFMKIHYTAPACLKLDGSTMSLNATCQICQIA
jgi:glutamyl-tRNA reductase